MAKSPKDERDNIEPTNLLCEFPMRISRRRFLCTVLALLAFSVSYSSVRAADTPLDKHCADCHSGDNPEGEFRLESLTPENTDANIQRWLSSLERVRAKEMPPPDSVQLSAGERAAVTQFLTKRLLKFRSQQKDVSLKPRRLNNREFANSVRDALLIEDVGTHLPTDNLIGDSLHKGFDTHGETLGFSKFHLEQYIVAVRRIVDATILTGDRPKTQRYQFRGRDIVEAHTSQNTTRPERRGTREGFDFLDPEKSAYLDGFKTVPTSGWYRIVIRCTGKDRGVYDSKYTGIHDDDPIRLTIRMGDREKTLALQDETEQTITINEWLAAGTRLRLQYPTDGLRLRGNGNFKFQHAIAGSHIQETDPKRWAKIVADIKLNGRKPRSPASWHNWVKYWRGPRPRIYSVAVEGPSYTAWPPARQTALFGTNPKIEDAEKILRPIAERAWRRKIQPGELRAIVKLVEAKSELDTVNALKEGLVAVLVSPQFLLLNQPALTAEQRFAEKFSYFLNSTLPDSRLRQTVADGQLGSFELIKAEVARRIANSECEPFLRAFPFAWLQLNDINFMAPDPERFFHFHRKRVSEDMVDEALHFFKHAVTSNISVPEFLSANYSFVNADLAQVYGLTDVPPDSEFRKYTFRDGRRGGLTGMGAFLTVTADSLSTSPIHRAVYVMENFLGIHPTPPPADVEITEPDVRQAKTIREILDKHRSDKNCASCHQRIDPYGYAFENFDPAGAWRDVYTIETSTGPAAKNKRRQRQQGIKIPIDAGAQFRDGSKYDNIVEFRRLLLNDANRDRFVRNFIVRLLTYANGAEPAKTDFTEIDAIVAKSAANEYRIVETIAAVIDSPLFRERY